MMGIPFAQRHAICDMCVLAKDVSCFIDFYVGKIGFTLNRHEKSFAELAGAGLRLPVRELDHGAHRHFQCQSGRPAQGLYRCARRQRWRR